MRSSRLAMFGVLAAMGAALAGCQVTSQSAYYDDGYYDYPQYEVVQVRRYVPGRGYIFVDDRRPVYRPTVWGAPSPRPIYGNPSYGYPRHYPHRPIYTPHHPYRPPHQGAGPIPPRPHGNAAPVVIQGPSSSSVLPSSAVVQQPAAAGPGSYGGPRPAVGVTPQQAPQYLQDECARNPSMTTCSAARRARGG
jgi:hypothetical protein